MNICQLRPSYTFRLLQGHHQEDIYKFTQVQQIISNMCVCRFKIHYTELSKKMDGIWNRYNLKSTRRIYTFGVLKCSEKFKVLDLP